MIPYGRQTIEEDDIQAVVDVLRSDYLTTGPKIAEFEKMLQIMLVQNMRWQSQTEHRHFMRHVLQQGFSRGMK